jgi:SHS2 domain-containing protein
MTDKTLRERLENANNGHKSWPSDTVKKVDYHAEWETQRDNFQKETLRASNLAAELAQAKKEIAMLNKWADGFSDAQIKERQTGEMYQRELRAELAQSKKEAEQAKLEVLTLMERDRWIGQKCKYYDFDTAKYIEAKFIALSFSSVDREPIVQAEGRMPVFTTWNSVKGLPELEIKAAFNTLTSTAESAAKYKAEIEVDAKRLDFVLENCAFTLHRKTDTNGDSFQLYIQAEDEDYICLHNRELFFKTAREAIDAAMATERKV